METDPRARWLAQARRCRTEWRRLTPDRRDRLVERLERENHPVGRVWIDILRGAHPLVPWLEGDAPASDLLHLVMSPDARQLISSHPFSDRQPWSTPLTSPASS